MPPDANDDDYGFDLDGDAALAAALEAAERQAAQGGSSASVAGARQQQQPPVQPRPQKIAKPAPQQKQQQQQRQQQKQPIQQPVPQRVAPRGGSSKILVSPKQRGNPILSHIKSVAWEYDDKIVPDYVVSETTCVLFLSLKYHKLHPDYIYTRLRTLGNAYRLRILLTLLDIDTVASNAPLKELQVASIAHNYTLILSFNATEAAHYLTSYKLLAHTAPTAIMERKVEDPKEQVVRFCTTVRGINKNDAGVLMANYGSVAEAVAAKEEELRMLPGWGRIKAERWKKVIETPFVGSYNGEENEQRLAQKRKEQEEQRRKKAQEEKEKADQFGAAFDDDEEALQAVMELEAMERESARKRRLEEDEYEENYDEDDEDEDMEVAAPSGTRAAEPQVEGEGNVMAALQKMRDSAK